MSDDTERPEPHETRVEESDPSGDSVDGLAGDMGISSERVGPVRGRSTEATHGAEDTHPAGADPARTATDAAGDADDTAEAPPEQSADPATGEPHPANDVPAHPRNPPGNPGHSHG